MNALHAVVLGIVEGVTEFLPISSTGHLMLTSALLGLPSTETQKTFDIVIQLGAILAIVLLYIRTVIARPRLLTMGIIGFIPTALAGFLLHDIIRDLFLESIPLVGWSLLIGGIVIVLFECIQTTAHSAPLTVTRALGVGLAQCLALIPGVSRSAAAILGGMATGLSRKDSVEFAFILAVPTMLGATGLDLLKVAPSMTSGEWLLLGIGFVSAFLTAIVMVRWLLRFITHHSFAVFGWYRILAGAIILLLAGVQQ